MPMMVSFESMKKRASRPAKPCACRWRAAGSSRRDLYGLSVNKLVVALDNDLLPIPETGKNLDLAVAVLAGSNQPQFAPCRFRPRKFVPSGRSADSAAAGHQRVATGAVGSSTRTYWPGCTPGRVIDGKFHHGGARLGIGGGRHLADRAAAVKPADGNPQPAGDRRG